MMEADQNEAIAFLSNPETFGVDAVQRIDTHASIVFLAGGIAYKLKRAVKFGYLDYSTRARRRLACATEIKINRRFSPEIYLGVRTIRRDSGGKPSFSGHGQSMDWVVEMRRFDTSLQLDVLAGDGRLTTPMMTEMAARLAEMHARAPVVIDQKSPQASIRALLIGVKEEMERFASQLDPAQISQWYAAAAEALPALDPLLEARHRAGDIRWCHGDLHLANWCLFDGRPMPFDALEFSRDLATTDVLYDLAFPLMDLDHYGRIEAANAVFNRYFDIKGDESGIALLPFFQSLRAAIRSHVLAAAAEQQRDGRSRQLKMQAAQAYLVTAQRCQQRHQPRLVAIGGYSGSGKSTLAYSIAPRLGVTPGARVLRSDVMRKKLHGVARHDHLPAQAYDQVSGAEVYRSLCKRAAGIISEGGTVIVDAVFARETDRLAIREVAEKAGVPFSGLWLEVPGDILTARLQSRPKGVSDADQSVLRQQIQAGHGDLDWHHMENAGDLPSCRDTVLRIVEAAKC